MTAQKIPLAALGLFCFASTALAQREAPPPVDDATRKAVIERIAELVDERYVFPDVANEISARLRTRLAEGAYAGMEDAFALAQTLTRDLQSVNGDKHFNVQPVPPEPDERSEGDPEATRRRRIEALRRSNFGFQHLEVLDGNVGYLDLRMFADADAAGPTAVAAMGFLANTDAILVDLRQNGGGSPSMIQLITSYFFEEPTHLNSFFKRGQEQLDQFWTLAHVSGSKRIDTPLFVLTSSRTGSAAEEFAYNLKHLERATLVGETTGGAAHPGDLHRVPGGLAVFISDGRAINPITGTNWEGVGVKPHIDVPAANALATAHLEALRGIESTLPEGADRSGLEWAIAGLEAQSNPVALAVEAAASFAGSYGPRRIALENGELYYSRDGRPRTRLVPMSTNLFALEGIDFFRVLFERGADGSVTRLIGLYDDGRREPSPRDE